LPALYIIVALTISIDLLIVIPKTTWPGIIIVIIGVPIYFLMKKTQKA
jgi:APA family basic amino acid/polyamine antiporter